MPSLFTRIINRELPGRFVYEDEQCVAFLSIHPLNPGHTLVVPRQEIAEWTELGPELLSHLFAVSQRIARAQQQIFKPLRVGLLVQGLEVPHVHIHVVPVNGAHDLEFAQQDLHADPAVLDATAERLRKALRTSCGLT
jgi:histidine triad (HIT) family protein